MIVLQSRSLQLQCSKYFQYQKMILCYLILQFQNQRKKRVDIPNPSKSKVNFKFNTNSLGKIEADIININGGLVLHLFNGVMLADN